MSGWRWLLVVLLTVVGLVGPAQAAPLRVEATPLFGAKATGTPGWTSVLVRLHNDDDAPRQGEVVLRNNALFVADGAPRLLTRAPFSIEPKGEVTVQLPLHPETNDSSISFEVGLREGADATSFTPGPALGLPQTLLLDLSRTSRIAAALDGRAVLLTGSGAWSGRGPTTDDKLSVLSPSSSATSGDLILPDRAAGYFPIGVVLSTSRVLARLTGAEQEALANWVLGGGTLAIIPDRPEDLRAGLLPQLVGGPFQEQPPEARWQRGKSFRVEDPEGGSYAAPTIITRELAPSAQLIGKLHGYGGGNLRGSEWGATASYGLGELHLLAFDLTEEQVLADPWTQLSTLELVRQAVARRNVFATSTPISAQHPERLKNLRRLLDPNESSRWAIGVATLLLLFYAVLAGPFSFYRAQRRGRPLRAYLTLPLWSLGTLALVVVLGMVAKGINSQARRLTLVEAGAGMTRGVAVRYRGLFASSTERLMVRGTQRESVLDLLTTSEPLSRELVVDRDGARLERLEARPWQMVLLREDGFAQLGGGLSVVPSGEDAIVKNRTARALLGVVVKLPGQPARYFERLADGEARRVSDGARLDPSVGLGSALGSGGLVGAAALGVERFATELDHAGQRLSAAWGAVEDASGPEVNWWPADVPVVLALMEGGEGKLRDTGMQLREERLLLRVLGWGGVP